MLSKGTHKKNNRSCGKKKRALLAIIAGELLILLLYCRWLNVDYTVNLSPDAVSLANDEIEPGETGFYTDTSYKDHNLMTSSFGLRQGIYSVHLEYQLFSGDAVSFIQPTAEYGHRYHFAESDDAILKTDVQSIDYKAWVHLSSPVTIVAQAEDDGAAMLIKSVTVTRLAGRSVVFYGGWLAFLFLVVDAVLALALYKKEETAAFLRRHAAAIVLLPLIAVITCYPFLSGLHKGIDLGYHLNRIGYLAEGIEHGVFPVRILAPWGNGHGAAVGVGYSDWLLLFPALLEVLGMPLWRAYVAFVFAVVLLTAFAAYYVAKRIAEGAIASCVGVETPAHHSAHFMNANADNSGDADNSTGRVSAFTRSAAERMSCIEMTGIAASCVYSMALFHLYTLYTQAGAGAFSGYLGVPLVFYGMYRIYCADPLKINAPSAQTLQLNGDTALKKSSVNAQGAVFSKKKHLPGWIILTLGVTLVVESHVITTFWIGIFLLGTAIVCWKKTFQKSVLMSLGKALLAVFAVNASFWVPLLDYMVNHFVSQTMDLRMWEVPTDLVSAFSMYYNATNDSGLSAEPGPGLAALILFGVILVLLLRGEIAQHRKLTAWTLVLAVLTIWFSTSARVNYILFHVLAPDAVRKLFEKTQFPWRVYTLTCWMIALLAVIALTALMKAGRRELYAVLLSILLIVPTMQCMGYAQHFTETKELVHYCTPYNVPERTQGEFIPDGCNADLLSKSDVEWSDMNSFTSTSYEASITDRNWTTIDACVNNGTGQELRLTFPVWAFKGYHAKALADGTPLTVSENSGRELDVTIPADFEGNIRIYWSEPWYWRASELVTLAAIVIVALSASKALKS
ncbi:MAG: hypothetical protein PUC46_04180 [Lachnospiraceae bacterium]|nr:hypothetical protein [Lachnospiraceae bacterium]